MQNDDKPKINEKWTGHVQKRIGKALMHAVTQNKSEKFVVDTNGQQLKKKLANPSWGEKCYSRLGGVSRRTKKAIMSIQGDYSATIWENDALESLKSTI
mgnify:FL=1